MITRDYENSIQKLRGLSTDTKPTDVPNGAEYLEMDTGTLYRFNAVNSQWIEQAEGGGADISVVPMTASENGTYTAPSGTAYSPVTVNVPGSGSETVVVTYTMDEQDYTVTCDKTYNEINTLINSGAVVVADMVSGSSTMRGQLLSRNGDNEAIYFSFCEQLGNDGPYTIDGLRHGRDETIAHVSFTVSPYSRFEVNFSRSGGDWSCDKSYSTISHAVYDNVPIYVNIQDGREMVSTTSVTIDGNRHSMSFVAFNATTDHNIEFKCVTITSNETIYYGYGTFPDGGSVA